VSSPDFPKGDATSDKESVELEESASASYTEKDLENLDISSLVDTVPNGAKMSFKMVCRSPTSCVSKKRGRGRERASGPGQSS
jgi:hypothetical protein